MKRYNHELVKKQAASIAAAAGLPGDDAAILADSLVDADVHGISTHGVSRLNIYIRRIQKGLIDPEAKLVIERVRPSVLMVNASNGIGQVQASKVLSLLMDRAQNTGTAAAAIHNSQHFGTLSYYCARAAAHDMVLLAFTNAEPSMSPTGGREAYFGTNPIAAAFPSGKGFPVRIDMATSLVARGNIVAAHKRGEAIPEGWALDEEGNPTTDAAKALAGTVLTMAGHKGYALAVLVELFSGVLSGAAFGASVGSMYKHMDRPQNVGHFFCLFDIAAFMDVETFKQRIDRMIDEIKACRKRPGVEEILVPGEPEHKKALFNKANGIPLDAQTLEEFSALCKELHVAYLL